MPGLCKKALSWLFFLGLAQGLRDLRCLLNIGKIRKVIVLTNKVMTPMDDNETELFNDVYKEIGNALGLDAAIAIYQMYKGQQITFPIHLFNVKRIQKSIIKEYDGSNIRELAKKYGYSEKTVRRMIKDSLEE